MATILHVADPRIDPSADPAETDFDCLDALVERARALNVEAVLFTGNLFSRGRPDEAAVERVAGYLDDLDAAGVRFLAVLGRNDRRQRDALAPVFDHEAVERLGTDPADVGEYTAVYGLDHRDADDLRTFLDGDDQFTHASGTSNAILAVPQKVAPPIDEAEAATRPYEVASNVNVYLDAIAGGGVRDPATWEHDDNEFGVYYPGSMNDRWAADPAGPQAVAYDETDRSLDRRQVPLDAVALGDELASLETLLGEYDRGDLESADVETLTDLYGLLAEAKSMLDDRRKEVRDVLLDRTAPGTGYSGSKASIHHHHSTYRQLRDEESVLTALEGAGVDREAVTTETVDEEKVAEVVEERGVPEDAVFEERTRTYIQKRDLNLDGGDSE